MELQDFLDNFNTIAQAPGGVQRLRELILDLAVRGKLVEQEKQSWKQYLLNDISIGGRGSFVNGPFGSNLLKKELTSEGAPVIYIRDIRQGVYKRISTVCVTPEKAKELEVCNVLPGDVLVAKVGSPPGKAAIYPQSEPPGIVTQDVIRIRVDREKAIPGYVRLFLNSPYGISQIEPILVKANRPRFSLKNYKKTSIILPSLAEQELIVARVDELMGLCDELEKRQEARESLRDQWRASALDALMHAEDDAALEQAWARIRDNWGHMTDHPDSINALRQAILQLAVRGKLVEQDPNDEPASELLARIAEEKAQLIKEKKIRKTKKLPPLDEGAIPFDAPVGWSWAQWQQTILDITSGWSPSCEKRQKHKDEWGVLKVSAVSWGEFRPEEHKALPAYKDPRPEHEVQAGDFLMSRANTAALVGRSVVVEDTPPQLMMSDKILRVQIHPEVDRKYLNIANLSPHAREYYADTCTGTSDSMRNVSRDIINAMPIPVPPTAEQERIVAKVDEMMEMCDRLEAHLRRTYEVSEALAAAAVHHLAA